MPMLKYEQIAEDLRARMANGEFGPGDLLPSGRDLAEQWIVSRATAVKAYDVLRNDGLVVARQGAGFTVAETPIARSGGRRHSGSSCTSGGAPHRRIGAPGRTVPPPRIADALGLEPDEEALRRVRVVLLDDGSPHSLVTAWFPRSVVDAAPRLARKGLTESAALYVRRETGRFPVEGMDVTTVRLIVDEEARLLEVDAPAAVAVVLHVAVDQDGRPLVAEESVMPSQVFEQTEKYTMGQEN
ncbi:GntR family transcriptional regulator [Streptomyces sp. NPDC060053]|uniref:GntR family transcriptional regulator n=1 Tax=Streptomyces sp. NPDC060053 TaxID=3347047 RepID=UPI0036942848